MTKQTKLTLLVVAALIVLAGITLGLSLATRSLERGEPTETEADESPVLEASLGVAVHVGWDEIPLEQLIEKARAEEASFRQEVVASDLPPVLTEAAPPRKQVKRWAWEAPEETRAKLWNVPEVEDAEALATAFLRVCISEADGHEADCLGIWQVIRNIRSRSCDRARVRKITECDDNGETMLSVMRRASKSVLGVVPPRSRRQSWISQVELECTEPPSWPGTAEDWQRQYGGVRCPRVAKLARQLAAGETEGLEWPIKGVAAVTWGGRCESGSGACDDDIACARGLARIWLDTHNAFWCLPGTRGCSTDIEPLCLERGFPSLLGAAPVVATSEEPPPEIDEEEDGERSIQGG